jgi:hypothetical protein
MSAFIVPPQHLRLLVATWASFGRDAPYWTADGKRLDPHDRADRQAAIDILAAENARSVNARYNETTEPIRASLTARDLALSVVGVAAVVRVAKAISCYEYQSCEHAGWETSEAKANIDRLARSLFRRLPGYEEAAWSIDSEPNPENTISLSDLAPRRAVRR